MEKLREGKIYTGTVEGYSSEGLGIVRLNGAVVFLRKIARGGANRSFGIEMTGNDGEPVDYFVRRYRATQAISDVVSEHELIAFCIERGLDMAAGLEKMEDGKTYTFTLDSALTGVRVCSERFTLLSGDWNFGYYDSFLDLPEDLFAPEAAPDMALLSFS